MTKQLQKELLEKVKPGVKASDLKKLKRSKSAGDIPKAPPLPNSTNKEITQLQEQVKFHTQTASNYLKSLQTAQAKVQELEEKLKNNPPSQLLQDQLKEKQKEIEKLRKALEEIRTEVDTLKKEKSTLLDDNLSLKHQGLKDWFKQYQQTQKIDKELAENIEQASNELEKQDEVISQLRTQNSQLKETNQSLQKDLNLATKLAEMRKVSYPLPEDNGTYLKYALYSLAAVLFTLWLTNHLKTKSNNNI